MSDKMSELGGGWWAKNLDDVDREVARLATLCKARLLDPGVIERVLHNDATVCGTQNKAAFDKLRQGLMMHYHVKDRKSNAPSRRRERRRTSRRAWAHGQPG